MWGSGTVLNSMLIGKYKRNALGFVHSHTLTELNFRTPVSRSLCRPFVHAEIYATLCTRGPGFLSVCLLTERTGRN